MDKLDGLSMDIEAVATELGVTVIDMYEEIKNASGIYHDDIHINAAGQKIYWQTLEVKAGCLRFALESKLE